MSGHDSGTGWYLKEIGRVPLLTPDQEIELGHKIQRWLQHEAGPDDAPRSIRHAGKRAKDEFVAANLRLAVSFVTKHCGRLSRLGYQDDLIQAANLGLIRAVEKFDPTRGYRFSTYAYWWIRQSVNRWVDQHSRLISIPGSHSQLLGRVEGVRRRLREQLMREPTVAEVAVELDVALEALEAMIARARGPLSLDHSSGLDDEGGELGCFVGVNDPDIVEVEAEATACRRIEALLMTVTPQQARLVRAVYGLSGPPMPIQEVAHLERISTRQAQRLINDAVRIMGRVPKGLAPRPTASEPTPPAVAAAQLSLLPDLPAPHPPTSGSARRQGARRAPCSTRARRCAETPDLGLQP